MILDLDIGNTLSKWRLKDAESSEIRSRGAVWTREEWRPGADIPDLDVVEAVRISSVARAAVLDETVTLLRRQTLWSFRVRSWSAAFSWRQLVCCTRAHAPTMALTAYGAAGLDGHATHAGTCVPRVRLSRCLAS